MNYAEAVAYLDTHINVEALPERGAALRLDRMRHLLEVMADPQHQYPVLHLTGTNGKTSTARLLTRILAVMGLATGTYTSPHLERINERISWAEEPISDAAFAEIITGVAAVEGLGAAGADRKPSYFELLTAAAYRFFADVAVDAAVVEVGLGGRNDATNVADGRVAVITNIGIDHVEYLGPTREGIAREKSGIIKPGSHVILGEDDPGLAPLFRDAARDAAAEDVWVRGQDFGVLANDAAHGGRLLSLRTPGGAYEDVFLNLHGAYQGDNAACALAAAEAFFGGPLPEDVVTEAFASARSPGRLEVAGRQPLCILDGAHNADGARALAAALAEEFATAGPRVVVLGLLQGRDPGEIILALDPSTIRLVVACPPPSPRALDPEETAHAARAAGLDALIEPTVPRAIDRALAEVADGDLLLITGSLYTVGAARTFLLRG